MLCQDCSPDKAINAQNKTKKQTEQQNKTNKTQENSDGVTKGSKKRKVGRCVPFPCCFFSHFYVFLIATAKTRKKGARIDHSQTLFQQNIATVP